MKLRWREMQALHVLRTDLHTGWIGILIHLGLDGEARIGRGLTNYIDHHLATDQRPPPPILGNMTKHPVFDLMPLTGPRRKVSDVERDPDLIGALWEFDFPQPLATGIAPPAIGRDEDRVSLRIRPLAHMPPPAPDGFHRKLGGVVIDPHTDPTAIVRWIVPSIGTNLAQWLVRNIVGPYAFRLPVRLGVPSPIGKRAHECLLFRIHRNDWLPRTLKHFHTAVDIAKLGLPIRMRRPLSGLARAL
jgi:hypothetical protein